MALAQMISPADRPLIVQGDHTVLLEADHPRADEARDRLLGFAELVKSPEHVHTYRVTPLSVWHARAAGLAGEAIVAALAELSRFPVPANVAAEIRDWSSRYGRLRLLRGEGGDRTPRPPAACASQSAAVPSCSATPWSPRRATG